VGGVGDKGEMDHTFARNSTASSQDLMNKCDTDMRSIKYWDILTEAWSLAIHI